MVEYLLSLPRIQDVTMEDGTTAFAMALGRRDLEMIKAFMNSSQLCDIDHIKLAKRALIELDRETENKWMDLRNELANGLNHHNVVVNNDRAERLQISEE